MIARESIFNSKYNSEWSVEKIVKILLLKRKKNPRKNQLNEILNDFFLKTNYIQNRNSNISVNKIDFIIDGQNSKSINSKDESSLSRIPSKHKCNNYVTNNKIDVFLRRKQEEASSCTFRPHINYSMPLDCSQESKIKQSIIKNLNLNTQLSNFDCNSVRKNLIEYKKINNGNLANKTCRIKPESIINAIEMDAKKNVELLLNKERNEDKIKCEESTFPRKMIKTIIKIDDNL